MSFMPCPPRCDACPKQRAVDKAQQEPGGLFESLRNALRDDACANVLWTGGLLKRAPVNVFFAGAGGVKK